MKRLALLIQLIIIFLLGGQALLSQTFPVQIVPQAIPPAPIYFSDYADESTINSPLRVQLILNDLTITNREVRLKTYFEGSGISFQSNDLVTGSPLLFLEGGIPLILTNVELAPYFKFENISGISPNVYGQAIPEGSYQFCFEVYDVATGNRLSNRSCAGTVIFQNNPPILIAPQNKSIVEERNPQNIFFQWTPRHINVSNVEYELSIVEIWDNQVDYRAAFLSAPPIFTTTTTATTYLLGPADPILLPDRNYAWRVQAKAKQGTEEVGLFKNQGYSEIFVFGNTDLCDLPSGIAHEVKGATNANILWNDFTSETPEFIVRYRQKGNTDAWFHSKTTSNTVTLWDLKAGTEYEYQVAKKCALSESEYSILDTFRTNLFDEEDSAYECGISPNIDVTNQVPLENLEVGEKFTAGDFPVTVMEVNGGNGYFNGKGYVTIPYLKSIKVAVEFTNIFINQNKELAQGNVMTLYDPSLSGIVDPWDWVDDVGDIINGGDHTTLDPVDFEIDRVTISDDKNDITFHGTDENGNPTSVTYPYDEGDRYSIQGGDTMYSVDENGNLNEVGNVAEGGAVTDANTTGVQPGHDGTADDPSVVTIDDTDIEISYIEDSSAKYGWDDVNSDFERSSYPKVALKSGGTAYPIHKAVANNGPTDTFFIDIKIKSEDFTIENLIFKTVSGLAIETAPVSGSPNRLKVTIKGNGGYRNEEAVITYKESEEQQVVVSSFFIHHLRPIGPANVTLVPVNGYAIPSSVQTSVAAKFAEAGVSLNIIEGANFNSSTSGLRYTESGLLSKHPESFKNFYEDFKTNSGAYRNDSYYVFVFDENVQPGNNLAGFMPRGTQFGFVFPINISTNGLESKQTVTDVVAHEVGHGVLGLKHPFESGTTGKGTDWLMDYGSGNALSKADWESAGNDGLQLYVFDDDGDGEARPWEGVNYDVLISQIPNTSDDDILSFVSLAGVIYSIPGSARDITFINGFLVGFTHGNERHIAKVNKNPGHADDGKYFLGYSLENNSPYQYDSLSATLQDKIKVYYAFSNYNEDCTKPQLYSATYVGESVGINNKGTTDLHNIDLSKRGLNVKSTEVTAINTDTSEEIKINGDIFNCLKNGDLKALYKQIEYTHKDKELGFLNDLFTELNEFKEVYISGITSEKAFDKNHFLNIESYGDVTYLWDAINSNKNEDVSNEVLKIVLKDSDGEELFPEFVKYIPYFNSIYNCLNQEYGTLDANRYYVPLCIWKDAEVGVKYSPTDSAFMAGIADGGIGTVVDLYKLGEGIIKLKDAYGPDLFQCESPQIIIDEYGKVAWRFGLIGKNMAINLNPIDLPDGLKENFDRLLENHIVVDAVNKGKEIVDSGLESTYNTLLYLKQYSPSQITDLKNRLDIFLKSSPDISQPDLKRCENAKKTREQTIEVLDFLEKLSNPDDDAVRKQVLSEIKTAIDLYIDKSSSTDNFARYNHGKVVFVVISEIGLAVATGGSANIAKGTGQILSKMSSMVGKIDNVVQLAAKKINAPGLNIQGGKLVDKSGPDSPVFEIKQDGVLHVEDLAPENLDGFTTVANSKFDEVDLKLKDGTELTDQAIEIVQKDGEQYVRLLNRTGFDELKSKLLRRLDNLPNTRKWVEKIDKEIVLRRLNNLDDESLKILEKDIVNIQFANAIERNPDLIDSWKLLDDAGRTGLKTDTKAIEALQNLRTHPKTVSLKQGGKFTDVDLASIQGFSGASYEEVTNQITRLLSNHSNSTLNGFESIISTMKRTGGTQADNAKKGMYWVIRDVANDVDNLAGKNLNLEFGVSNARGNTSRIDVFCSNCDVPNLKIEYKSGPGSIKSTTIKEQFIERDLFNANSLNEIQWRMDGTDFTADKLKTWLKENKSSITNIIDGNDAAKSSKFKEFFEMSDFDDVITDIHINDFVDSNYNLIFR